VSSILAFVNVANKPISYRKGQKLHGIIYLHRITDVRVGGVSKRNFNMFRKLCGNVTLKNVLIVTNMWGDVSEDVGEAREAELANKDMFFKPALDNHAQLLRHTNTLDSARLILRQTIGNHPMLLDIQRELVDECKDISQTTAGAQVGHELSAQLQHRQQLTKLRQEMRAAIRAKDEESMQELEDAQREVTRVSEETLALEAYSRETKTRADRNMQEMVEAARQQTERVAAEQQYRLQVLRDRLQSVEDDSALSQKTMRQQLAELERQLQRN
jgi:hypothetical protein